MQFLHTFERVLLIVGEVHVLTLNLLYTYAIGYQNHFICLIVSVYIHLSHSLISYLSGVLSICVLFHNASCISLIFSKAKADTASVSSSGQAQQSASQQSTGGWQTSGQQQRVYPGSQSWRGTAGPFRQQQPGQPGQQRGPPPSQQRGPPSGQQGGHQ